MKKHYLLLVGLFVMPILFFAQDFKGLKSISGNTAFSFGLYSNQRIKPLPYEYNSVGLNLNSPFYGKFLTNRLFVGGESSISIRSDKRLGKIDTLQSQQNNKSFSTEIGLSPMVRFYLNDNPKFRIFLQSQATLGLQIRHNEWKSPSFNFSFTNTGFIVDDIYVSLGMNKPLDTHIYWESQLRYEIGKGNTNVSLSLGLQNFMPRVLPKKTEEGAPQYLAKGRSVFDAFGSAYYSDYGSGTSSFGLNLNYFQAKFVTDKIAIGSNVNVNVGTYLIDTINNVYSKADINFQLNPIARYYVPLTKRFYVYPQVGVVVRYDNQSQGRYFGDNRFSVTYNTSVGFNYFVNQNVAYSLNFNLNKYNNVGDDISFSGFETGIRVGVVYFIDKVKL
jgi:hypothetical protein